MGRIRRGGRVLERPNEIKEEIAKFFEELYTSESFHRPTLDGIACPNTPLDV